VSTQTSQPKTFDVTLTLQAPIQQLNAQDHIKRKTILIFSDPSNTATVYKGSSKDVLTFPIAVGAALVVEYQALADIWVTSKMSGANQTLHIDAGGQVDTETG
jgi:frataxin-like iron-binding protein CyaY